MLGHHHEVGVICFENRLKTTRTIPWPSRPGVGTGGNDWIGHPAACTPPDVRNCLMRLLARLGSVAGSGRRRSVSFSGLSARSRHSAVGLSPPSVECPLSPHPCPEANRRLSTHLGRSARSLCRAATGRNRNSRFGVRNGNNQTFAQGDCRRQPSTPKAPSAVLRLIRL